MRTQYAAANWKMNLTFTQGNELIDNILIGTKIELPQKAVIFAVPFPYLQMAKEKIKNHSHFFIAAQNCYNKKSGAFTGEISAEMLASMGVQFVVLGHSERREYFAESNAMIAEKINLVLENKMKALFCCGESLQTREANQQNEFVAKQIQESLFHLSPLQFQEIIIAYEPIWAIGTGKTASSAQAEDMHAVIRKIIAKQYGEALANETSILYGGSAKASNAKELFACPNVDGALVGGASLIPTEFIEIIKSL